MPNDDSGLPGWASALAVVAHPDDESFGLGAVIASFVGAGTRVDVLCLTHGEASTLHGVQGDLGTIRRRELADAGEVLGIDTIHLLDHPDGRLGDVDLLHLSEQVSDTATELGSDGILVFDVTGITGHPDHVRATSAAVLAARRLGLDVLAWTLPLDVAGRLNDEFDAGFVGRPPADIDVELSVDRSRQLDAVVCHPSQAVPGSALWRRLELLGDREYLRWLTHVADPATDERGPRAVGS
ncbi:MAG: PIG-L family deacetylase [Actinobacteria bacterium]|jgi:LmbE family N-acetylglucosaminyl deacetylase|nr:PIG-L family deacetylase [Actinomycetota bacterium]